MTLNELLFLFLGSYKCEFYSRLIRKLSFAIQLVECFIFSPSVAFHSLSCYNVSFSVALFWLPMARGFPRWGISLCEQVACLMAPTLWGVIRLWLSEVAVPNPLLAAHAEPLGLSSSSYHVYGSSRKGGGAVACENQLVALSNGDYQPLLE